MNLDVKLIWIPLSIAVGVTMVLLFIRITVFRILHRWARRTETELDDIIIHSFRIPSIYWCIAIGLYTGIVFSRIPENYAFYLNRTIHVLIILSITFTLANLASRIFRHYLSRLEIPLPSTGLVNGTIKGIIIIVGILVALTSLGISITPIITALGVGGLAIALALQDTLSNLFAGIHILVERSIRVGDFVRLENGQEGYVEDISWRTTRIRMLPNNMIIIPNNKLAQSIVTNYYLPEKRLAVNIPVSVSYSSDPEKVEAVLRDILKESAGKIPGLLEEPAPDVRFIPGFGESSLDFTLVVHVGEFRDQYHVQHELRKRIFKRFREVGIEIPFPHRTVYLRDERKEK